MRLHMGWFTRSNNTNWYAIRGVGDHAYITEVELRTGAKPLIKLAQRVPADIRSKEGAKAIATQYALKGKPCCFVLDAADYQLLQVEKPTVPIEEQKQALRWKLKDMLDYSVEQATIDFIEIPSSPEHSNRQTQVYAFAVNNQLLATLTNHLIDAGVQLKAIDARVIGQRNVSALLAEPNRGIAMLSFTKTAGLLTFTVDGELYHVRAIEFDSEKSDSVYERIVLELQRSLDNFERQYPHIPITSLHVAPFEDRDSLCPVLRESLYIAVNTFELGDIFEYGKGVDLEALKLQGSILPLLGAALREGGQA